VAKQQRDGWIKRSKKKKILPRIQEETRNALLHFYRKEDPLIPAVRMYQISRMHLHINLNEGCPSLDLQGDDHPLLPWK
jgi:hypothetical protein